MQSSNVAWLSAYGTDWVAHPAFGALLFTLLCLWPLAVIFRRSGRNPWLALLFLLNAGLPYVGYIAAGAAFAFTAPRRPAA